ncbi:hypothetical protein BRD17_09815 [Halobacteriales archaeon SW_7_68_16]|nr:MAG: hypothetical protein BRD17_09815 [Halobacteriales archaeon SW_7_68_16]
MVSLVAAVGLTMLVGVNTLVAAVLTRYFRLRLSTRWGSALYTALFGPVALVIVTLLLSGGLGLGGDLGGRETALLVSVVVPLTLGYAIDLFWMPPPDAVDLPADEGRSSG